MSELTDRNPRQLIHQQHQNIHMEESMSTEWTDEKHSSFLNSMEAMFVNQLYNHEYSAMDSQGWRSRRKNQPNPSSSGKSNAKTHTSDQFEVLQDGCWRRVNYLGLQHELGSANESHIVVENPRNSQDIGRYSTILNKSPTFQADLHQDSVVSYKEVSDQNFVDAKNEPEQTSHVSRKKRMKAKVAKSKSKDQVVPIVGSLPTIERNKSYPGKEHDTTYLQLENTGGIMSLEGEYRCSNGQEEKEGQ